MPPGARGTPRLESTTALVRDKVGEAAELLGAFGVPRFEMGGSMLRPLTAFALGGGATEGRAAPRFWSAALAVQLAHEASLLHDDVIDGAAHRRGVATVAASRGPAAALLIGDHALTASYRAAAMSADVAFMSMFARAVERTVAGERAQATAIGTSMDLGGYRDIVLGKSGELFGCAAAIGPTLLGSPAAPASFELGRRVGLVYQMLDDLLDYCPGTETGKPALGDGAQGRWTWPLSVLEPAARLGPGSDAAEIVEALFARRRGGAEPLARAALRMFDAEVDAVSSGLRSAGSDPLLVALLEQWRETARVAVCTEESRFRGTASIPPRATPLAAAPSVARAAAYMSHHSRSFRFAALVLPREERRRVERVYAWCRYTDDIVDTRDASAADDAEGALDAWLALSRSAYGGAPSGIDLLDEVMGDMARHGVPFSRAELLIDGVRTDLRVRELATMAELRDYTYRVASAVGLWLCGLYSVTDGWMLERASALGHAMQLTNILRDVGEDLGRGRLYIPLDCMGRHGLDRADLTAMRAGSRPISAPYRGMMEEMMERADASYRFANEAIPYLPAAFGRSVAVASAVYSDIHRSIRAIGYDTLRHRAYTSRLGKVAVGARALVRLRAPGVVVREQGVSGRFASSVRDRHVLG